MRYLILTDTGVVLGYTSSKPIAIRMFETFCRNSPNETFFLEETNEEDQTTVIKRTP